MESYIENSETGVWLQFSNACIYITNEEFLSSKIKNAEVGQMPGI